MDQSGIFFNTVIVLFFNLLYKEFANSNNTAKWTPKVMPNDREKTVLGDIGFTQTDFTFFQFFFRYFTIGNITNVQNHRFYQRIIYLISSKCLQINPSTVFMPMPVLSPSIFRVFYNII